MRRRWTGPHLERRTHPPDCHTSPHPVRQTAAAGRGLLQPPAKSTRGPLKILPFPGPPDHESVGGSPHPVRFPEYTVGVAGTGGDGLWGGTPVPTIGDTRGHCTVAARRHPTGGTRGDGDRTWVNVARQERVARTIGALIGKTPRAAPDGREVTCTPRSQQLPVRCAAAGGIHHVRPRYAPLHPSQVGGCAGQPA